MKVKLGCLFMVIMLVVACVSCSSSSMDSASKEIQDAMSNLTDSNNKYVLMVKGGYRSNNPDVTYDKAFSSFFGTPRLRFFESEDGLDVVEFTGDCTYQDVPVKARIQFVVDEENGTFEAVYLAFNEVPQGALIMAALIEKALESVAKPASQTDGGASGGGGSGSGTAQGSVSSLVDGLRMAFVDDQAGLLNRNQQNALEVRAKALSEKYQCGIFILTVDDIRDYGYYDLEDLSYEVYFDYDLGYGSDRDCLILALSMDDREFDLRIWGEYGKTVFTSDRIDDILDNYVLPLLKANDYNGAFSTLLDRAEVYFEIIESGYIGTITTYRARNARDEPFLAAILVLDNPQDITDPQGFTHYGVTEIHLLNELDSVDRWGGRRVIVTGSVDTAFSGYHARDVIMFGCKIAVYGEYSSLNQNQYLGEVLYDGIPLSIFFEFSKDDIIGALGVPRSVVEDWMDYQYDGVFMFFDDPKHDLTVCYSDYIGVYAIHFRNPSAVQVDGMTLDKDRNGLVAILGSPSDEGWGWDYDDEEDYYYMRYDRIDYSFGITMGNPSTSPRYISVWPN